MRYMRSALVLGAVFFAVSLSSCESDGQHFEPQRVERHEQAGSTHVAVLSVSPWTEYLQEELQPKFNLKASDALNAVVPDTRVSDEQVQDMFRLLASLSFDDSGLGGGVSAPAAAPADAGGDSGGDGDGTGDAAAAGDAAAGDAGADAMAKLLELGLPLDPPARRAFLNDIKASSPEKLEPMLRYALAAALFQEVKMLDRYVKDVALRKDYNPYVVRMQITVSPRIRNAPYDVYTTASFFTGQREIVKWAEPKAKKSQGRVKNSPQGALETAVSDLNAAFKGFSLPTNPGSTAVPSSGSPLQNFANAAFWQILAGDSNDGELPAVEIARRRLLAAATRPDPLRLARSRRELNSALSALSAAIRDRGCEECLQSKSGATTLAERRQRSGRALVAVQQTIAAFIENIRQYDPERGPAAASSGANSTDHNNGSAGIPFVVPLLVTDSLEASFSDRSTDVARQYGFALEAMLKKIGLKAEAERFRRDFKNSIGRDLNSVFSVGRLSDNSLRIRMGAMLQNESGFAMVPQNRYVSFLLLVPKEYGAWNDVNVATRTEFVDTETGVTLKGRNLKEWEQTVCKVFQASPVLMHITDQADQLKLAIHAHDNRFDDFKRDFSQMSDAIPCSDDEKAKRLWVTALERRPESHVEEAWLLLTSLNVYSDFSKSTFSLPGPRPWRMPLQAQDSRALIVDDGKSTSTVTLLGGEGLDSNRLNAWLEIKPSTGDKHILPSNSIRLVGEGRRVTVSFRSLLNTEVTVGGKKVSLASQLNGGQAKAEVVLVHEGVRRAFRVTPMRGSAPKSDTGLKIEADSVVKLETPTKVPLRFEMSKASDKEVEVSFEIAFKQADGSPATGRVQSWAVSGASKATTGVVVSKFKVKVPAKLKEFQVELTLSSLEAGSTIEISAKRKDKKDSLSQKISVRGPGLSPAVSLHSRGPLKAGSATLDATVQLVGSGSQKVVIEVELIDKSSKISNAQISKVVVAGGQSSFSAPLKGQGQIPVTLNRGQTQAKLTLSLQGLVPGTVRLTPKRDGRPAGVPVEVAVN